MTIVTVLLIGAGALLIASSLDCTSLKDTFQKIVSGQVVDWSGTQNCNAGLLQPRAPTNDQIKEPTNTGACPDGYIGFGGLCYKIPVPLG